MARTYEVTDGQLLEFRELIIPLAERRAARHPNEYDDLVQEGLIYVWKQLRAGKEITEAGIDTRMRMWIKFRSNQLRDNPTDYERLMEIEEL